MRDIRTLSKDTFLSLTAGLMQRSISRWIPGCPRNANDWQHARISYSQFGEDLLAETLLRSKLRPLRSIYYVDIGCWDPVRLSNSFLFYQQGAHGIAVDPNPEVMERFKSIRPRDTVVQAAISSTSGNAAYCRYEWDETNALIPEANNEASRSILGQLPKDVMNVTTLTLAELFERHVPPTRTVDLLDVDCEGHDLHVLASNDWSKFRPLVVMVEAHGEFARQKTCEFLRPQRYELFACCGPTMIFQSA